MERPPKLGGDLWIVGVMAGVIAVVIGALLVLAFSQGRELEAPEKPAPSAQKENLSHKP